MLLTAFKLSYKFLSFLVFFVCGQRACASSLKARHQEVMVCRLVRRHRKLEDRTVMLESLSGRRRYRTLIWRLHAWKEAANVSMRTSPFLLLSSQHANSIPLFLRSKTAYAAANVRLFSPRPGNIYSVHLCLEISTERICKHVDDSTMLRRRCRSQYKYR